MPTIEAIEQAPAFRKWRDAFRLLTGLDVHLIDGAAIDFGLRRAAESTEFCRLLCSRSDRCAQCRKRFADRLRALRNHHPGPFAMRCFAGLTVTALPLTLGDGSIAFLYSTPIVIKIKRPVVAANVVARRVAGNSAGMQKKLLRKTARSIPVRERRKFNATITLLQLLAAQISHLSRQMLATPDNGWHDDVTVKRCRELIELRFTEDLHISQVAEELGVNRSHLSHLLTRHLGVSFTDYLHGLRVAELKRLLRDSDLNITEALFAAGFQSVSQANRVFRDATGMAPSGFRGTAGARIASSAEASARPS